MSPGSADDMFTDKHWSRGTRGRTSHNAASCIWLFFAVVLILAPAVLRAQSPLGTGVVTGATTLTLTPSSPDPGEQFEVRVEAYAYDMSRTSITWSIHGAVATEYTGERSITLTAPALGVPLAVGVRVVEQNGAVHTAATTVTPSALDLVVESDTRVPYFYRGRALPSPGSAIRLIALPSVYMPNGGLADSDTLIYTWRINTNVVKAGIGQNTLITTMPRSGSLLVEITAETQDGRGRHTIGRFVDPVNPQNFFYEDNPLYGRAQNALPMEFTLLQDEISIHAEPYFVAPDIFSNATYGWTLDGTAIQNPNADQQTLTLRKTGGKGSARVAFSVRNMGSLLQAAASEFVVYFEK